MNDVDTLSCNEKGKQFLSGNDAQGQENVLKCQKDLMEYALTGKPFSEILEAVVHCIEAQCASEAKAGIFLLNHEGKQFNGAFGSSLPLAYRKAIDGTECGPDGSPFGIAAYYKKIIITKEIAIDPLWATFKDLALTYNLKACWLMPIVSGNKVLLGLAAIHYSQVNEPSEGVKQAVSFLLHTASLIIEHEYKQRIRFAAEKSLRLGNEYLIKELRLYETILSKTPDLVYVFDLNHRFTYANQALLEMWGCQWENAIGKNCLELGYEPWHAQMHDRELEQVVATKKPIRGEVPFTGPLGRRIYDYIFTPVVNEQGEVEAVVGTTRDVTSRKEAEETLRKSESRFRFLTELESATRGVSHPGKMMEIVTQMTAQYLKASRCAYADVEPDGDHFTIRADYVADDSDSTAGYYSLDLFGEKAVTDLNNERTLIIRDVNQELSDDDGGAMFRSIGIHAIITCPLVKQGRLHAMMAVHQNAPRDWTLDEIKLMEMVAERSWSYIERVRHEAMLREADQRKDEFLATLAHELRNPLAPIHNALHIFSSSQPPQKIREAHELITRQVNQMIRLVDDLMDVSRITHGKIELKQEIVLLSEVIKNALETSLPLIREKNHAISIELGHEPICLKGDFVRLSQVFANLLNNAAKYTEAGGKIQISAKVKEGLVTVCVMDNGVGIDPTKLDKIFDLFIQVDNSIERAQGGLGIGLTLVKNLIERQGGTIKAFSEGIGQGATFVLTMPCHEDPLKGHETPILLSEECGSVAKPALKVLVVDDNTASAQTIGWTIELLGFEAKVLTDGMEAIEESKQFLPDVVLLDIGMPKINGYEICRVMRNVSGLENTLFIAQTGWGQEEHRQRSKEAGFHYHLVKPIDFNILEQLLLSKAKEKHPQ